MKHIISILMVIFAFVVNGAETNIAFTSRTVVANTNGWVTWPVPLAATNFTLGSASGALCAVNGQVSVYDGVANALPYWTGIGAGQLGSTAAGTNGQWFVGRTGDAPTWALQTYVSITDPPYLADNTGTLDAYAALTNALATKRTVIIPDGTFKIDKPITLNTNQTVQLLYTTLNMGTNSIFLQSYSGIRGIHQAQSRIVFTGTNTIAIGSPVGGGLILWPKLCDIGIDGWNSQKSTGIFMNAWAYGEFHNMDIAGFGSSNRLYGSGISMLGSTNGECSQNRFYNIGLDYNDTALTLDTDFVGSVCGYNDFFGLRIQQGNRGIKLGGSTLYGAIHNHFYSPFIQGHTSSTNNAYAVLVESDGNSFHDLLFDAITGTNIIIRPTGTGPGATANYFSHLRTWDADWSTNEPSAGPGNHIDTMNNFLFSPYTPFDFQNYNQRMQIDMSDGISMLWRRPGTMYMNTNAWQMHMASNAAPHLQFINELGGHVLTLTQTNQVGINITDPRYPLDIKGWSGYPATIALSENSLVHGVTTIAPSNVFSLISAISQTGGGLNIKSITSGNQGSFTFNAIQSATPTVGWPSIEFNASRANGTGLQSLGSTSIVFRVRNYTGTTAMDIMGNNYVGFNTTDPIAPVDIYNTSFKQLALHGGFDTSQYLFAGTVSSTIGSYISGNAYNSTGPTYMPSNTAASIIAFRQDGSIEMSANTSLTAGTAYTPTVRLTIANTGVITSSGNLAVGGTLVMTNVTASGCAGIDATVDVLVSGATTNRMVYKAGILISNITSFYAP
jgi:hypothetical protein